MEGNATISGVMNVTATTEETKIFTLQPNNVTLDDKSNFSHITTLEYREMIDSFDEEQYARFQEELPAVIFLALVSFIGTIGNINAFLVYWFQFKSSCHRTMVLALAAVDLFMCATAVPYDIIDIRFNTNGRSGTSCRIFIYIDFFLSFVSVMYLTSIAIHRYRKVCRPLRPQFTSKQVKIMLLSIFVACGVFSLLVLWFYGRDPTISDHHGAVNCLDLESPGTKLGFKIYIIFSDILSLACLVICFVCYFLVAKILRIRMKTLYKKQSMKRGNENENCLPLQPIGEANDSASCSTKESIPDTSENDDYKTLDKIKQRDYIKFRRSLQITLTFAVASGISFTSWITSVTVVSIGTFGLDFPDNLATGHIIIECLHYINHMANPVVYIFIDSKFREEFIEFYKRIFGKCKRKFRKEEKTSEEESVMSRESS